MPSRRAQADQVGLELGHHREHIEQQPSDGTGVSYTDPPRFKLTRRAVSSAAIARASGRERASRSSLVTTTVSPARHAASGSSVEHQAYLTSSALTAHLHGLGQLEGVPPATGNGHSR
jgi:hypothetical protein